MFKKAKAIEHSHNSLRHVAIIMDGNNRWAKKRKLPSRMGHKAGAEVIRKILKSAQKNQLAVVTLFAFSSENWDRPTDEVEGLMDLLTEYLSNQVEELKKQNVAMRFIGRRDRLRDNIVRLMVEAESEGPENTDCTLVFAIDYGGLWDIAQSVVNFNGEDLRNRPIEKVVSAIDSGLTTAEYPAVDLCIRTGNEFRISNFLIWQMAYAELYFSEKLWPDFDEKDMQLAIDDFNTRQRRFGKTGDQVANASS